MPFKPGQSGNPGRPRKIPLSLRDAARALTPETLAALKAALAKPGERVPAATLLLAYAWGKPINNVQVRVISGVQDLTDDELRTIAGVADPAALAHDASDNDATPDDLT
jgi:hypothetical protein